MQSATAPETAVETETGMGPVPQMVGAEVVEVEEEEEEEEEEEVAEGVATEDDRASRSDQRCSS